MKLKYKILSKLRKMIHVFGFTKIENSSVVIKNTLNEFYIEIKLKLLKEADLLYTNLFNYGFCSRVHYNKLFYHISRQNGHISNHSILHSL